jgi:hypothetical protein
MLKPTPSDRNAFCYSARSLQAEYCVAGVSVQQPRSVIRSLDPTAEFLPGGNGKSRSNRGEPNAALSIEEAQHQ